MDGLSVTEFNTGPPITKLFIFHEARKKHLFCTWKLINYILILKSFTEVVADGLDKDMDTGSSGTENEATEFLSFDNPSQYLQEKKKNIVYPLQLTKLVFQ